MNVEDKISCPFESLELDENSSNIGVLNRYVRILGRGYYLHTHITHPGQKITKAIVRFAMCLTYFPFYTLGDAAISFMMDIFVTFLLLFPVNLGQSRAEGSLSYQATVTEEKREK